MHRQSCQTGPTGQPGPSLSDLMHTTRKRLQGTLLRGTLHLQGKVPFSKVPFSCHDSCTIRHDFATSDAFPAPTHPSISGGGLRPPPQRGRAAFGRPPPLWTPLWGLVFMYLGSLGSFFLHFWVSRLLVYLCPGRPVVW